MKQLLLFTLAYFLSAGVQAQVSPLLKAHAYIRHSTPGAVPKVVAREEGSPIKKSATALVNYSIYIEVKKGSSIIINRLWIEGKAFKARKETVLETPVVFKQQAIGNQYQTDTLVQKTNHIVWKLVQDGMQNTVLKVPEKSRGNALLIEYSWKGKKYYYAVKEWKKLPPLILQ